MRGQEPLRSVAMIVALAMLASGCAWVDRQFATGPAPGAAQPYPNLASVPNRPPDAGTARQRLAIEQGLLADRTNARHVAGPVAAEERGDPIPDVARTRPAIIDPRAPAPPAAAGERRTAAAQPEPPRLGPGGAVGAVPFRSGSTALGEGSGRMIVRAAELQRRLGGTIVVMGQSTKAEGDDAARRATAEARARTVANGLLNLGVAEDRIRVVAGDGRVDDSRVDIAIIGARAAR